MKRNLVFSLVIFFLLFAFIACDSESINTLFPEETFDYLSFKVLDAPVKFSIQKVSKDEEYEYEPALQYSKNGVRWTTYKIGTRITLKPNAKIYFRAKEQNLEFSKDEENYFIFAIQGDGKLTSGGNIMYLLDPTGKQVSVPDNAFIKLFSNSTWLLNSPNLPATELGANCYKKMFEKCSNLTSITVGFSQWNEGATEGWVTDIATQGSFYSPSTLQEKHSANTMPLNWTVNN